MTNHLLTWITQAELDLKQRLAEVQLAHQLGLPSDQLERLETFYGIFLNQQLHSGQTLGHLTSIHPALTAVTLTWRAANLIDAENFAEEYRAGLNLPQQANLLETAGEAFAAAGLFTPAGLDATHLAILNAGLINNEVAPLLEYLDGHLDTLPTHFAALSAQHPGAADEVLTTARNIRDFSLTHPKSWFDRRRDQLEGHIETAIAAELRERPAGTIDRGLVVGVAGREQRPRTILDLNRRKLYLRLPEQQPNSTTGEVNWRVTIDGTTKVYRTGIAWGDETGFTEALDIAIDHPVRELTVHDVSNNITWTVPIIDAKDPLLLFTARGANVTANTSLHYGTLHALAPTNSTLSDPINNTTFTAHPTTTIEGWDGWTLHTLDTSNHASISLNPTVNIRSIDPHARVTFHHPEPPTPHLHSANGLPIHTTTLSAEFPPTPSGQPETWHLTISAYAGPGKQGEEVAPTEELPVPAEGGSFQIFDPELYDAPWVGEYLIRIHGPRGESFRHEYAIVEDLHTAVSFNGASQAFRIPTAGGLTEVQLTLGPGSKPFEAQPATITVGSHEATAHTTIHTEEGDQLPLTYTPPRLGFELPLANEPAMWRATRLGLSPKDFHIDGTLRVRGNGPLGNPTATIRNLHGTPIATTKLTSEDNGITHTTPIAHLRGQSGALPTGRLDLEWTDVTTDRRISVALADIANTESDPVTLDGATLHLPPQHSAWVWPATAPWEPARALASNTLPADLHNAGALIVQPFLADPFATLVTPVAPGANAVRLEQPGHFIGNDPALGELSAFISGESEHIPSTARVLPMLWEMLNNGIITGDAIKAVHHVFAAAPAQALGALAESLVPQNKQPGRVVEAGLVRARFESGQTTGDNWMTVMALLGELDEHATAGQPHLKELKQHLLQLAGPNLVSVLLSGRDETLATACIDRSTVAIAAMDASQQQALLDMFFSDSSIVPGAIMDDGSRLLAVFEAFNQREELNALLQAEPLIQSALTMLRTLRATDKSLFAHARIRFDKLEGVDTDAKENLWALTPVVSLVFALVARLHAHGLLSSSKTLDAATPGWAKMADLVPDLVTGDLISAEAMVLAAKHQGAL